MYLRGGSKEAHIWVDGWHIYFDVSWEEGRWNQVHPHLKYKRCDNCSGYSIFKKPNGENDSIHTFIYVDYSTEEGPKVHFDEIIISDFNVYVKQAVKKEFEDGSYIYEYSPIVMPRSPQFSVDISNYANLKLFGHEKIIIHSDSVCSCTDCMCTEARVVITLRWLLDH